MDEIIESGHGYEGSLSISHDENHNNIYDRGMIYNINNIIGCGIFVIPGDVWRLVRSPGAALILWLIGELGIMFPRAGELQYIKETFYRRPISIHIFSFAMIFVMRPTAIVANTYFASLYLIYAIRGKNDLNPSGYFSEDSLIISFIAIAILFFITAYHMYSRRLAVRINIAFAVVKCLALICIIIVGIVQLQKTDYKKRWTSIFNNTISDQRTLIGNIGSYGNAMLEILFTYEGWNSANSLNYNLNPRYSQNSTIYSVIVAFSLYALFNVAYITVVNPEDFVRINDASQIDAMSFGSTLIGKKLISILIVISSCGAASAMIFSGSEIIAYATKYDYITYPHSKIFCKFHYKFETPINALLFQFFYCSILIILLPQVFNILLLVHISVYPTILYYGFIVFCLM
ncbi:amino acid/polyamine transporter I, partial [Gigaspora rosea]